MKSFLSIKGLRKAKRSKKPVLVPSDSLFKNGKTYPLYISDDPVNENDPANIKEMEEAVKSLTECPIPDWVLKRHVKKED